MGGFGQHGGHAGRHRGQHGLDRFEILRAANRRHKSCTDDEEGEDGEQSEIGEIRHGSSLRPTRPQSRGG